MSQLEILAVLLIAVAIAHWLGDKPGGRLVGSALLVIILAAGLANLGFIPLAREQVPVYNTLLGTVAPISIFLLLLKVRLRSLTEVGLPMLMLFALAAAGTVTGVLLAGWLLDAGDWMGQWYGPLSGMFAATYIGGGANFNALAIHYEVMQSGNLYAAAVVADHILTVVWIALLLIFPRVVGWFLTHRDQPAERESATGSETSGSPAVSENPAGGRRPGLGDLVALLALGVAAFVLSEAIADWFLTVAGVAVPPILILTTLALILAQFELVARLRGGQMLGMFGAYLFLAALGAYCEVAALGETGWLGVKLMAFVTLLIVIHGLFVVVAGRLMRQSAEVVAVASATTVGGATVVLPLVERFGRQDLLLPGIVLGTLGNLLGTYIGFALVYALT